MNSYHLQRGSSARAALIQETLRQQAIHFSEPEGPLNGVLYSLIRSLIVDVDCTCALVGDFAESPRGKVAVNISEMI